MPGLSLNDEIAVAVAEAAARLSLPERPVTLAPCRSPDHGDLSTNIALLLARETRRSPMDLAQAITGALNLRSGLCSRVAVAPPGFINFLVSDDYWRGQLAIILQEGEAFGRSEKGKGKRALVEFVSANPTGPLTVGHGRQAVLGDCVARILGWHGYEVTREYYFNDAGRQMRLLGQSVYARYMEKLGEEAPLPDGGYEGDYIREIAAEVLEKHGDSLRDESDHSIFKEAAVQTIFEEIKETVARLGITFDSFINEKGFYEDGSISRVLGQLRERGVTFDSDGATWLKTTSFGKEQDTVLVKSSGEPTYRLPDIAYHASKLDRGYDLAVDIFGADHQDTYPDVLAALTALGRDISPIRVLIHQFVTLKRGGELVKMSTRKATFVTLDELIDRVGADVARYFFVMRGMTSHLNFDLDLAIQESEENPVYYLQYAHARICSILRFASETNPELKGSGDVSLLTHPAELALLKELCRFPAACRSALETLEPQGITLALTAAATLFHKFYTECRVVTADQTLSLARLALVQASQIVLSNGLHLLGVNAPERM